MTVVWLFYMPMFLHWDAIIISMIHRIGTWSISHSDAMYIGTHHHPNNSYIVIWQYQHVNLLTKVHKTLLEGVDCLHRDLISLRDFGCQSRIENDTFIHTQFPINVGHWSLSKDSAGLSRQYVFLPWKSGLIIIVWSSIFDPLLRYRREIDSVRRWKESWSMHIAFSSPGCRMMSVLSRNDDGGEERFRTSCSFRLDSFCVRAFGF